jgi:hypothetical protein
LEEKRWWRRNDGSFVAVKHKRQQYIKELEKDIKEDYERLTRKIQLL